ncbi:hypothetical protein ACRYJU_07225 [Alloalcanivorax xenomutans]|uniref:hypothetical protein n=1 Tax=Alloalcanivorax xenomutans TaxID=1094342 RepID=UPI003D9B1CE7
MAEQQRFVKKPVEISATQWFRNGDHPLDHHPMNTKNPTDEDRKRYDDYLLTEGKVVRYYRHPEVSGKATCQKCGNVMHRHGWIDTLEGGHIVCPGDWIITGVQGEHYPCKPDIFEATYQPAGDQHPDDAAVDQFAAAMKAKLAKKRAEGRGGWQTASEADLSALLHEHVAKGDPLDVGNLAMMLHQNGQRVAALSHAEGEAGWRFGYPEYDGDGGVCHIPLSGHPDFMVVAFNSDGDLVDSCGDDVGYSLEDVERWRPIDAHPAPQVATGWRTGKDGAAWPKQGALYLIKLNGVLQHEVYEFDQADDGGFGGGQHFWSREDLDECPPFDPERDEWLPLEEAGFVAAPQVAVPEGWKLVPVEPTDDQFAAALHAQGDQINYDAVYAAMVAAAPTSPAPTKGEEIHVNVDGDSVYTLPLEPTGMAAPRFVVHVPAPDEREIAARAIDAMIDQLPWSRYSDDHPDVIEVALMLEHCEHLRAGKEGE